MSFNPHSPDCKLSVTEEAQYKNDSTTGHMFFNETDMVNHPPHYTAYEGFEVIDITKQLDFLYGNAVKYILRAPHKSNEVEDIEKAIWYLNKKLEELK